MSETLQIRNAALVNWLSGELQPRYEPNFAWKSVVSAHLALPALRAFWPMSSVDFFAPVQCRDIAGSGYHLVNNAGVVTFGYDPNHSLVPIANFGGAANQYLSRADGGAGSEFDIIGTEAYILPAQRGLTLGGWFWWTALPGALQFLIAKDSPGVAAQYSLRLSAANLLQFFVWPGAIGVSSGVAINTGWNHCVGIYDQASQDLSVVLNGVVTTNAGAAPAALADTGVQFTIGADGAGANRFTGYASDCFLCAASVPQAAVRALFQQTQAMYGV